MNLEHIEIKPVILSTLSQFAEGFGDSNRFEQIIPITVSRARAQSKNPYAKPDDIVLFLALKNKQIIGYLGRFPGILSFKNDHYRVFWGSTFFLMDKFRGKGIGKQLLDAMVSLNQDFVVTRITPEADKVLKCYGMKVLGVLNYFQFRVEKVHFFKGLFGYFINNENIFAGNRQWAMALLKKAENFIYKLEKRLFYSAIDGYANKLSHHYQVRVTDKISDTDFDQLQQTQQPFFYRGPELINWMIQNRWILSKNENVLNMRGYYFSDVRELFTYIALKLYCKTHHHYRGFIVLCISSNKGRTILRVLDHYFKTDDVISGACAAVFKYAQKYQADRIEFSNKMGCYLNSQNFFKKFLKKQHRHYLYFPKNIDSPLERLKNEIRFDYCDGDTAFT